MGNSEQGTGNFHRTILGVSFFGGPASDAVAAIRGGGLLVSPAAPALKGNLTAMWATAMRCSARTSRSRTAR